MWQMYGVWGYGSVYGAGVGLVYGAGVYGANVRGLQMLSKFLD